MLVLKQALVFSFFPYTAESPAIHIFIIILFYNNEGIIHSHIYINVNTKKSSDIYFVDVCVCVA